MQYRQETPIGDKFLYKAKMIKVINGLVGGD